MMKRILHIDMDAFFASVEVARNPRLRGKPVVVGGAVEDRRGVVSSASYEARQYGVHSAMPLAQARRCCPQAVFIRGNHALYEQISRKIHAILETVSPWVEMASIDEAYIDITGSLKLFGGDDAIAWRLKDEIRKEVELPCTIAIASNRLLAKVAANEVKPDGYIAIPEGGEAAYLAPLPLRKMPGAGPKTCLALESLGLLTIGQLADASPLLLEPAFGTAAALSLQQAARGQASDIITLDRTPKSISRETTFPEDLTDWEAIGRIAVQLAERCAYTLREEGMEARRVTLKVRYGDFETKTFAHTLPESTSIDVHILTTIRDLLPRARESRKRVRLIGVHLSMLSWNQHQMALFDKEKEEKWERVLQQVDSVRGKLGFHALHFGGGKESPKKESDNRDIHKKGK